MQNSFLQFQLNDSILFFSVMYHQFHFHFESTVYMSISFHFVRIKNFLGVSLLRLTEMKRYDLEKDYPNLKIHALN